MNLVDGSRFLYSELMDTEKFFGNPFCVCGKNKMDMICNCSDDFIVHDWAWDENGTTGNTVLTNGNREVRFHPNYSSGTAAVRGNLPFQPGHVYYWEIKMLTILYGTDVMVGVGTKNAQLDKSAHHFVSLLGSDKESWGFSYTGSVYHDGKNEPYGPPFQKNSTIGIYLDMWKGTLEFFLNRRPLGVAFKSLQSTDLYPMVCSTAAHSAMRITYSVSHPVSLKLLSLRSLSTNEESIRKLLEVPGLRKYIANSWWIQVVSRIQKIEEEDDIEMKLKKFACEDEPSIGNTGGCPSCCKQSVSTCRVRRVCVVCNMIL